METQDIEQIFEKLSSQYLAKIAEERKKADELQLTTLNNTIRDWMEKLTHHSSNGGSSKAHEADENEILKEALLETKDRQGKIIMVSNNLVNH